MSGQCLLGLGDPSLGCEKLQRALIELGHEKQLVTAIQLYRMRLRSRLLAAPLRKLYLTTR